MVYNPFADIFQDGGGMVDLWDDKGLILFSLKI